MRTTEPGCCEEFAALTRPRPASCAACAVAGAATVIGGRTASRLQRPRRTPPRPSPCWCVLSLRGRLRRALLVVPHGDPVYYAARPAIPSRRRGCWPRTASSACTPRWRRCCRWWTAGLDGRRARHRAAGAEPLALRGDGGARGRRPRLHGPRRLAQPADRHRRRPLPAPGHPASAAACRSRRSHGPEPAMVGRQTWTRSASPATGTTPRTGDASCARCATLWDGDVRSARGRRRATRSTSVEEFAAGPRRSADPGQRRGVPRTSTWAGAGGRGAARSAATSAPR